MSFKKFASFEVLSSVLVPPGAASAPSLRTVGHRVNFDYQPRPGFLYVRSRAISSRCNDNFDEFPAEEIEKAYQTFIGKPVFVNHHNDNHRRARGVIIDAALHKDRNPDGSPDTWAEVLMEVDAVNFPKLAKAIIAGEIDRTSMGTDVAYSICSYCGNKASSPVEYCAHIPRMKGKRVYRTTADSSGKREGVLIREICYGLGFFENSLLVEEPADPTAFTFGLDTRGLDKAASKEYPRFDGVGLKQDDDGWYVQTHRARSDSYPSPEQIPDKDVEFIRSTGSLLPQSHGEHGPWNLHGQCTKCGYTPDTEADEECDHPYCQESGFADGWHTKGEHIDPSHLDPGHEDYQSAERAIRDAFGGEDHSWLLDSNHQGPSHLSALEVTDFFRTAMPASRKRKVPVSEHYVGYTEHFGGIHAVHPDDYDAHDPSNGGWAKARCGTWVTVDHEGNEAMPFAHYPDGEPQCRRCLRSTGPYVEPGEDTGHEAAKTAASTDGYVTCAQGHTHWGKAGAAGLLMRHTDEDGTKRYFLQQRSPYVQHGGTYSTPGGALHEGEEPHEGAVREAVEEMGHLPHLTHSHTVTDNHGGWKYHTVVADVADRDFDPQSEDWEHGGGGWYTKDEMSTLPLHPGFAATLDHTVESSLTAEAKAEKPVGQMTPEEYAEHAAKREKDKADGQKWNRQNPVRIKHVVAHWDQATDAEKATGESWYADAHHMTKHIANDTDTPMHVMAGLMSNYSPQTHWAQNIQTAAKVARLKTGMGGPGSGVLATHNQRKAADRMLDGEHYDTVLSGPKTRAFAHLIEHGGNANPDDPKVVIDRHALSVAAGSRCPDVGYMHSRLGTKARYNQVSDVYHKAAKQISRKEGRTIEAHQVQAATWLVRQRLNEEHDRALSKTAGSRSATAAKTAIAEWNKYAAEHHPAVLGKEPGTGYSTEPDDVKHSQEMETQDTPVTKASALAPVLAYGETKAPANVDTLRDEECPVCGESDSYDGNQCQICGYDAPPKMFQDPNLDLAKQLDLRKDNVEDAGSLPDQQGLTDAQQDANGGLPGAVPGEAIPGSDETVDPDALDENGQPVVSDAVVDPDALDENGQPIDPNLDPEAATGHMNVGGEPFTPGPNAPTPQVPVEPGSVDPDALDEEGQPIEPTREGDPGTPEDGVADLVCPQCGFQSDARQPTSVDMDAQSVGADTGDGTLAGDVCPNCGQAQLLSVGEMEQMQQQPMAPGRAA